MSNCYGILQGVHYNCGHRVMKTKSIIYFFFKWSAYISNFIFHKS